MSSSTPAKKPRDPFVAPVVFTDTEVKNLARLLGLGAGIVLPDKDVEALQNLCALHRHRALYEKDRPMPSNVVAELEPIKAAIEHLASLIAPSALTPEAMAAIINIDELRGGEALRLLDGLSWDLGKAIAPLRSPLPQGVHQKVRSEARGRAAADFSSFYERLASVPEPEHCAKFVTVCMRLAGIGMKKAGGASLFPT